MINVLRTCRRMTGWWTLAVAVLSSLLLFACVAADAQTDWPTYGHTPGGDRFSPATQINPSNVNNLQVAWTYDTREIAQFNEATPIVVGGVMYFTTPSQVVVAVSPTTGKEIWRFDPKLQRPFHQRGVAYWPGDAQHPPRIIFATTDGRMIALDAKTGTPISTFGANGVVDLKYGVASSVNPNPRLTISSPPVIYKNLVIVGPETQEGPSKGPAGDPRAFDAISGAEVWRFHTVPHPGEPNADTWGSPEAWANRSGPSAWGLFTVDEKRGLVFIPTGNPADNMYGADRKGLNLYSVSTVALNANTGKLVWYFQLVHHDIWDYDVAAAPILINVKRNGKSIPAVAEIGKNGLVFILDELTGKPIYPVEERRVPKSDVPGEESWPTQPFPVKPPPLSMMSINASQLSTVTPESASFCRDAFAKMHNDGPYTPYGLTPTVVFPGTIGGGNWNGFSYNPALGYLFTNVSNIGAVGNMAKSDDGPMPYYNVTAYARFRDAHNYPCNQPPWGQLIAVNVNTGNIAWKSVLGEYPELKAKGVLNTGTPNLGGSIATAGGLVFVGATVDHGFRAFDAKTGKLLWSYTLDGYNNATPMTYVADNGKQYVVVSEGGPGFVGTFLENSQPADGKIIAFALPPLPGGGNLMTQAPGPVRNFQLPFRPGSRNRRNRATQEMGPEPSPPPGRTKTPSQPQTGPATVLPEADQEQLVKTTCTKCHGMATVTATRRSGVEWAAKINDMISLGAVATPEQIDVIENYLTAHFGKPVNINTAGAAEIEQGLLLSPEDAQAIVDYRQKHGSYKGVGDVLAVPGINTAKLQQQRANLEF